MHTAWAVTQGGDTAHRRIKVDVRSMQGIHVPSAIAKRRQFNFAAGPCPRLATRRVVLSEWLLKRHSQS